MLTKEEALSEVRNGRVFPDRLTQRAHQHYPPLAEHMLALYREGIGRTREELHDEVSALFWGEVECPPRRVRAFCKLLDDESDYEGNEGDAAAKLRMRVFRIAAQKHPLVKVPATLLDHCEADVKAEVGTALGCSWAQIEGDLFSDVFALHRLKAFHGYASGEALLSRYNEAQMQAVLYDATEMRIVARRDYKAIIRAAKLARLMHTAIRRTEGFEFIFDGPASALRTTKRYGILIAQIIPTLLACQDWEMSATIKYFRGGRQPQLFVTSKDRYRSSRRTPPEFDSALERTFAEKWGAEPREGWSLRHESEPQFAGQKAFFPDFAFEHVSGARVLFEIVGHWTPEYLAAKRDTLRQFAGEPLVLAVREAAAGEFADLGLPVVEFKSGIKLEPVLGILRASLRPGL